MNQVRLAVLGAAIAWVGFYSNAHADALGLNQPYQAAVPTIETVLGYPTGSRISSPEAIQHYFKVLAERFPEQVLLKSYGKTWEGRELYYAVISSAQNIAQLEQINAGMQQLADPRTTTAAQANRLIDTLPASIWLSYGVHGNEISSPEAAMLTAWHLLAADDEHTKTYLANTVVYVDPLQNPDGRGRFVSRYYMTIGSEPSSDRISAEHNEPWPNGRSNHYLFDMNRDWIALTQPEIAGQVDALLEHLPLVFVDLHEMGGDTSYYFTPEARPYNPLISKTQREQLWVIGENNAKWFDELGYDYFTREIFDAFYPGYGASWPLYHGTLSMTYEMASARGLHFRTKDGSILTYGDGVKRHFVASIATIESTSQNRRTLLNNFWQYRQQAIADGSKSDRRFHIFRADDDRAGARRMAGLLSQHGVEVSQAEQAFKACGTEFPAGSFIVDGAQPAHYMVRTLLDPEIAMDKAFLVDQERRRANNLPDEIYDVTAWSLPLMFNLSYNTCAKLPQVAQQPAGQQLIEPGMVNNPAAKVAFIASWGDMNSGRLLTAALRQGLTVKRSDLAFTHANGKRYPAGSLIFTRADNDGNLSTQLQLLAKSTGAIIDGVDRSWVTDGPNFGSNNVKRLHAPNIALAWDEPFSSLNAGHTRFVIEQQFNYPVTAIRANQLARADLSHYQVLILPSIYGDLQHSFGDRGAANIAQWVARGGVLITLANATDWAIEQGLLASAIESSTHNKASSHGNNTRVEGMLFHNHQEFADYIKPDVAAPYPTSGVLTRLDVDLEHWLTAGMKPQAISLTVGSRIYRPITIDNGRNVMRYAAADQLLASGYLWAENSEQLAHKPFLMWQPRGKGMVISFAQEPTYRAYLDGLNIVLMNAIFAGAAHATPLR
jgi:hypothetical protein